MEPTLPVGSAVFTCPTWICKPEAGEIIAYKIVISNRTYIIIHRIIGYKNNTLITKGDNRTFIDPWTVSPDQVLGVKLFHIPVLGYVFLFAKPVSIYFLTLYVSYQIIIRILKGEESEMYENTRR